MGREGKRATNLSARSTIVLGMEVESSVLASVHPSDFDAYGSDRVKSRGACAITVPCMLGTADLALGSISWNLALPAHWVTEIISVAILVGYSYPSRTFSYLML